MAEAYGVSASGAEQLPRRLRRRARTAPRGRGAARRERRPPGPAGAGRLAASGDVYESRAQRGFRTQRRQARRGSVPPMAAPLLAVDTPSMLYRAFFALPKSIKGDGRQAGQRAARHREPGPARDRAALAARGRPLLRARRRRLPDRALRRLPRRAPARCRTCCASSGTWPRSSSPASAGPIADHDSLEADDLLGSLAEGRGRGRRRGAADDRRPRHVPVRARRRHRPLRQHRRQARRRADRRRRGRAAATASRPSWCPTSSPSAAIPPTGSPARRASARRPPPSCCSRHGSLDAVLENALGEATPRLRGALRDGREQLLAFREIATLQDAEGEAPAGPRDRLGRRPRRPPRSSGWARSPSGSREGA